MKEIVYTKHAEERLEQREITKEDVDNLLSSDETTKVYSGNTIKETLDDLRVVYNDFDDKIVIITVFKLDHTFEDRVVNITDSWWKSSSKEAFIEQAYYLLDNGIEEDEIIKHLSTLYSAVCAEYGE